MSGVVSLPDLHINNGRAKGSLRSSTHNPLIGNLLFTSTFTFTILFLPILLNSLFVSQISMRTLEFRAEL